MTPCLFTRTRKKTHYIQNNRYILTHTLAGSPRPAPREDAYATTQCGSVSNQYACSSCSTVLVTNSLSAKKLTGVWSLLLFFAMVELLSPFSLSSRPEADSTTLSFLFFPFPNALSFDLEINTLMVNNNGHEYRQLQQWRSTPKPPRQLNKSRPITSNQMKGTTLFNLHCWTFRLATYNFCISFRRMKSAQLNAVVDRRDILLSNFSTTSH